MHNTSLHKFQNTSYTPQHSAFSIAVMVGGCLSKSRSYLNSSFRHTLWNWKTLIGYWYFTSLPA